MAEVAATINSILARLAYYQLYVMQTLKEKGII